MASWGTFVGREHELSRLHEALAEGTRLVLVVGDAGIGKSRFVEEGLTRAAAGGMLTANGGCLPLAEKLPLLPIADALEELSRLDGGAPFAAALDVAPAYVRPEVARLLPRLAAGEPGATASVEGWRHERLFSAAAELLGGVARRAPVGLLIEDVHWADGATLDFLTYLLPGGRSGAVSMLVTCRSDETPLDAAVADWLTHVRRDARVEEIRLGPLSQAEVAEQVAALVGGPPPVALVEEVYARAEGHPFFAEQLVAAAAGAGSGQVPQSVALPERLAELLVARSARCESDARAVLEALAVAGRPLTQLLLGEITGLDPDRVRTGVRELTAARLLAAPRDGSHRPRHALLGEAVAAELLPGEQLSLHERIARALQTTGGETLAAEAAGHWASAGRNADELQARLIAATAAEHVFAYADAAAHWRRAIELCLTEPHAELGVGVDLAHLYIRAVDALGASGGQEGERAVAEEAYRRFANHPDRATAAVIHLRVAYMRGLDTPITGRPLMNEALRLFDGTRPSAEHAKAWFLYAIEYLMHAEGERPEEIDAALNRALEVAEAAGASALTPQILCILAYHTCFCGEVEEGFQLLARARSEPDASRDAWAVLWLSGTETDLLVKTGKLEEGARVGLRYLEAVQQLGVGNTFSASVLVGNTIECLLVRGRVTEAAALIDREAMGPINPDSVILHQNRAEIDLVCGEATAAMERLAETKFEASLDISREIGQSFAEAALWAARPDAALAEVEGLLERLQYTAWVIFSGWLLTLGMRACADLAERGRARRDDQAVRAALATADDLTSWVNRTREVPFTEHPFMAIIPATRATWDAERTRASGASDPEAWRIAAERWETFDYRHRAAYARWRQAEALLAAPHVGKKSAATVLSAAAGLAAEHVPLTTAVQDLACRARIELSVPAVPVQADELASTHLFSLTDRELDVLRLLGRGKTNPEIAAALYISPRTAGVHVTHILRKLDATTRVEAATIAERAGLLGTAH